jgi:Holliday junction resolvase RusA-like endonuclease
MPYFIDATKELILQQGHHFHAAVLGKPEGLARPRSRIMRRAGTNNGNGPPNAGRIHVYCPSRSHQHQLRRVLRSGFGNPTRIVFPRDVGLDVDLQFFIARPASHFFGSGPNQVKSFANLRPMFVTDDTRAYPIGTPDLDNLVKFVLDDPLEGLVYDNDRTIVKITSTKVFDDENDCSGRIIIDVCRHVRNEVIHIT